MSSAERDRNVMWAVYGGCGGVRGSESGALLVVLMDSQVVRLAGCCAGENG